MNDAHADRNLALEAVRVTEAAAIAAHGFLGCGDERAADEAAETAMAKTLGNLAMDGTVCIGEADPSLEAPLAIGRKVGSGSGPKADVALLALEGKSIVARGGYNALSVIAMAEEGGFLKVPEIYMDKIAAGPGVPQELLSFDVPTAELIASVAKAKDVSVKELVVCMLDRPRHAKTVQEVRNVGARIRLILDGDVSGVIAPSMPDTGVDLFLGIGRAPQGVLAAAALRGLGGQMAARLIFRNEEERSIAKSFNLEDPDRTFTTENMAAGNVTFAATGVTTGPLLKGVTQNPPHRVTHSLVVRSKTRTLRLIEGHHVNEDDADDS